MRLNELFAAFGTSWPADEIDTVVAAVNGRHGCSPRRPSTAIEVEDVGHRRRARRDRHRHAAHSVARSRSTPPAPTRLTSHLFPSLGFTFHPEADWSSAFRVSIPPAGGSTVQIDSLPLDVAVPADLLRAHPDAPNARQRTRTSSSPRAPRTP